MKILTDKQYANILEGVSEESFLRGYDKGYEKGRDAGYGAGLIADKKGVHFTGTGVYVFEEGALK